MAGPIEPVLERVQTEMDKAAEELRFEKAAALRDMYLLLIKGILIGSLWIIWPFQDRVFAIVHGEAKLVGASPAWPDALDGTVLASFALLLAGFVFVLALDRLAKRSR